MMNIFTYIERKCFGLPTYDSEELIAAKRYRPSLDNHEPELGYDLYIRGTDQFMFGVIAPMSDENDLLDSNQIEERASELYKLCDK